MTQSKFLISVLALGLASACATQQPGMKADDEASAGAADPYRTSADTPSSERGDASADPQGPERAALSDEDFKVREVEEVKAPVWLPDVEREAQDFFREGVKAALSAPPNYQLAKEKFEAAIDSDSKFMEAYFNLGMVMERMGNPDRALDVYQNALDENPDNVSANAYVAKLYLGKARTARLRGKAGEETRWLGEAKNLLDTLIAKAARNEAVNNAMALYFLAKNDLETSERYVKDVLYEEPTNVTALNTRGLLNLQRGQYLIAEWIFLRKVLEQDPNSTEALTNLGYTYIKLGKRPLAMRYFKKALVQDSSNMDVRMNIAAMLLEHLNYAEAYEHYRIVREAEPLNLEAHEGLCDAAYGLGGSAEDRKAQFQLAINCFEDYMKKRPDRTDLLERIAQTYQTKVQDLDRAVEFFNRYLAEAKLDEEEKKRITGTVTVLKDIIASGGIEAMQAPADEEGDGDEDGGFESMDDDEGFESMDDDDEGFESVDE